MCCFFVCRKPEVPQLPPLGSDERDEWRDSSSAEQHGVNYPIMMGLSTSTKHRAQDPSVVQQALLSSGQAVSRFVANTLHDAAGHVIPIDSLEVADASSSSVYHALLVCLLEARHGTWVGIPKDLTASFVNLGHWLQQRYPEHQSYKIFFDRDSRVHARLIGQALKQKCPLEQTGCPIHDAVTCGETSSMAARRLRLQDWACGVDLI